MCRKVLGLFGKVPSVVPQVGAGGGSGVVAGGEGGAGAGCGAGSEGRKEARALRVVTWNTAGGQRSAQAPGSWTSADQQAAVQGQLQRWLRAYGCDVVALQECESGTGAAEILGSHELVGAVAAEESRGWVQLYVRRGLQHERIELASGMPCVWECVWL